MVDTLFAQRISGDAGAAKSVSVLLRCEAPVLDACRDIKNEWLEFFPPLFHPERVSAQVYLFSVSILLIYSLFIIQNAASR